MADTTNADAIDFTGTPSDGADAGTVALRPELAEVVEAELVEGEVVDERPSLVPSVVLLPVQVVRIVVRHQHARTAGRHLAYVPIGASVVAKRLWDSRSTSRYERFIRAAEATGSHDAALEWEERLSQFRRDRHQRRVDMIEVPVRVLLAVPKIALGLFAVLAALGVLLGIATKHIAEVAVPFEVVARIVMWAGIVLSVSWGPVVLSLPWVAMAALWHVGRNHANANMTGWLAPPKDDDDTGVVITADTIVLALQNLDKIPALKRAFKDGWRPTFHTLPVRDGRGYSAIFGLPLGVTAEMIADQRPVLARNVHRAEVEVWPSDAEKAGTGPAGTVALWIADSGVLSRPAPEYPLMHEGTADVFEGCPLVCRHGAMRSPCPSSATTSWRAARWGRASPTPAAW